MELQDFITKWVWEKLAVEVAPNQNLFEHIGFDSLTFSQLISAVEDRFDIEVSFAEVDDWSPLLTPVGLGEFILTEISDSLDKG
jgi:acyl carrier protein